MVHFPTVMLREAHETNGDSSAEMSTPDAEDPPASREASHASSASVYPEDQRYAVGDHCYFETSASGPYQIRRLEELVRVDNRIDVKVFIYCRKSDLPQTVQKQISGYVDGEEDCLELKHPVDGHDPNLNVRLKRKLLSDFTHVELQEHIIASRELFLNRDSGGPLMETLPTSLIRGKCNVLYHFHGMSKAEYSAKDNIFYCQRVWYPPDGTHPGQVVDDHEKVIHYDYTGTYQATVPPIMTAGQVAAYHRCSDKATLLWTPNQMSEDSVEHFIRVTMAVGVMARCLAGRSSFLSVESPALVARIAGCDTTHMLACDILHRNKYNLTAALKDLVGKDLKASRSLLETFDDNDMEYFQTGLVETGRNLQAVHEDWLPWRKYSDVVNFYYLYKGTDLYREYSIMKRNDRREKGHVTSVHVPYLDAKGCMLKNVSSAQRCYGCSGFSEPRAMLLLPAGLIRSFTETSATWYAWLGMSPTRRQIRPLCPACWLHWKRYACLRLPWKRNIERCNMSMPQFLPTPSLFPSKSLALGSACKQLLLSHRSPPPPEQCTFDSTEELGNGQAKGSVDEEEFEYVADRSWIIKRRVASESLYVPRRVALYPQMAVRDAETVDEYYRSCPAMVFAYHQQLVKKRRISIDQVISKVSLLKKQA